MKIMICSVKYEDNPEIYDILDFDVDDLKKFIYGIDLRLGEESENYYFGEIGCKSDKNILTIMEDLNFDIIYTGKEPNNGFFRAIPSERFMKNVIKHLKNANKNDELMKDLSENYKRYMEEAIIKDIVE